MELKVKMVEEGYEISGKPKEITLDRMRKFSGHLDGGENIHTNEKMAKEAGLPGPIAQGMMSYGYILEMILNAFGDKMVERRRIGSIISPIRTSRRYSNCKGCNTLQGSI